MDIFSKKHSVIIITAFLVLFIVLIFGIASHSSKSNLEDSSVNSQISPPIVASEPCKLIDIDNDGKLGLNDFVSFSKSYGKPCENIGFYGETIVPLYLNFTDLQSKGDKVTIEPNGIEFKLKINSNTSEPVVLVKFNKDTAGSYIENITKCKVGINESDCIALVKSNGNFIKTTAPYKLGDLVVTPSANSTTTSFTVVGSSVKLSDGKSAVEIKDHVFGVYPLKLDSKCGTVDSNGDGKVDIVDFSYFAKHYGKACPENNVTLIGSSKVIKSTENTVELKNQGYTFNATRGANNVWDYVIKGKLSNGCQSAKVTTSVHDAADAISHGVKIDVDVTSSGDGGCTQAIRDFSETGKVNGKPGNAHFQFELNYRDTAVTPGFPSKCVSSYECVGVGKKLVTSPECSSAPKGYGLCTYTSTTKRGVNSVGLTATYINTNTWAYSVETDLRNSCYFGSTDVKVSGTSDNPLINYSLNMTRASTQIKGPETVDATTCDLKTTKAYSSQGLVNANISAQFSSITTYQNRANISECLPEADCHSTITKNSPTCRNSPAGYVLCTNPKPVN